MADITNKNFKIPGVNQDTNYIKQQSYMLDGGVASEILETGSHEVIALNKGEAITKLRVIAVKGGATSAGSATVQFKALFDETAEAINKTAIPVADLAEGDVHEFPVNGIKGYDAEKAAVIQFVVGGANLTGLKLLLIVETLPVEEFLKLG